MHVGHPVSFDIYNQSLSLDINITCKDNYFNDFINIDFLLFQAPSNRSVSFQQSKLNENKTRIAYILNEIGE